MDPSDHPFYQGIVIFMVMQFHMATNQQPCLFAILSYNLFWLNELN
ncbi:hypothetical protein D917_08838 [Trichinella nativa]|uniref:Uncharacterized protein n=1 Tax=Trichinella nativa TaxID=6335 RepID=A0A1Y3EJ92_9BILA|nr:hypothetical protein D917_08838 [Trichinella nativa]